MLSAVLLSGCSFKLPWTNTYNLRQWEQSQLTAQTFYARHKYDRALKSYQEAVQYADSLELNATKLASSLYGLAETYVHLGDEQKAQHNYTRALDILDRQLLEQVSDTQRRIAVEQLAFYASRLAFSWYRAGNFDAATKDFARALHLFRSLGCGLEIQPGSSEKPGALLQRDYAEALAGSFETKLALGQLHDAEKDGDELFSAKISSCCPTSLLNEAKSDWAKSLRLAGKTAAAEDLFSMEKWRTATSEARAAQKRKQFAEMARCQREAVAIAVHIKDNELLSKSYEGLGDALGYLDQEVGQGAAYRSALTAKNLAEPGPNVIADRIYMKLSRVELFAPASQSEPSLLQWLKLRETLYGPRSSSTLEVLCLMAIVYDYHGLQAKADASRDQALDVLRTVKENRAPEERLAYVLYLGDLLFSQGKYRQAIAVYEKERDLYKLFRENSASKTANILFRIAACQQMEESAQSRSTEVEARRLLSKGANLHKISIGTAHGLSCLVSVLKRHHQAKAARIIAAYAAELLKTSTADSTIEIQWRESDLKLVDEVNDERASAVICLCGKVR